jgi:hypothetical protein
MRISRLALSALPVAAYIASAQPAHAAPSSPNQVYVLEIATDDADDQAKALTSALKARIRSSKDQLTLAEADVSLTVVLLSLKCGDVPDVACQQKIADKLNAEKYVWGSMRKQAPNQVVADLHYWQKGKPEARQQFTYSDNLTEASDPSLVRLSEQMVQRLVNFGKVGVARIAAEHSVDGELFVDGQDSGPFTNGQSEQTLPIGDHRFEVRSGGKVLVAGSGKVNPTTPLDVQLVAPAKTGAAEPAKEATPEGGNWKKTAGYVGVGVGGALILGGVFSMIKVNSINNDSGFSDYRKGFGPNEDVCSRAAAGDVSTVAGAATPAAAKSQCDSGSTFQTLQYVFFGLGVVAAGAGTYLLVTSNKDGSSATASAEPKPRLQVLPSGGQHGGGVDVRVVF